MDKIFYITGLNGKLDSGLGDCLKKNNIPYTGLELNPQFNKLSFKEKLEILEAQLDEFVKTSNKVIAVSFGAYLLLNLLVLKKYSNIEVLLLSPVLGAVFSKQGGRIPPNSSAFKRAVNEGELNLPERLKIMIGDKDPVIPVSLLEEFVKDYPNTQYLIIEDGTHNLPHNIVEHEILNFIKNC